jgi:hypothetical protein
VIGEPCNMVVMLDRDDMGALEAALGSEIGQRTAEDATANLARYATFRGMILQLDEVGRGLLLCEPDAIAHLGDWSRN